MSLSPADSHSLYMSLDLIYISSLTLIPRVIGDIHCTVLAKLEINGIWY